MALSRNVHSKLSTTLTVVVLAWIVQVVGLVFLQRSCQHHKGGWPSDLASGLLLPASNPCGKIYRWTWWCVFIELPVVLGLASSLLGWSGTNYNTILRFRISWIALLAVATVLQMWGANVALGLTDSALTGDKERTRAWVVFVGFVVGAATNFVMIFVLGDDGDSTSGRDPLLGSAAEGEL